MNKPDKNEYASYYETYINKIQEGDIFGLFENQIDEVKNLLKGVDETTQNYRYAEGKWNIKEILGHIIDTERIFTVRALCFSRNEKQSLPGFEQDDYVANANFNDQSLSDLLDQFIIGRRNSLAMFNSFDEEMWFRRGIASNNEMTVRSVPYIIVGHAAHHIMIIKERYLK